MVEKNKDSGSVVKDRAKGLSISKIAMYLMLALVMLITGLPMEDNNNRVAEAAPSVQNPDASNSKTSVDYLRKSDFTGTAYNKNRRIHPAARDEGFTCWANGNVASRIKTYSANYFNGSLNRAKTGGRGNEGFVETHGLLDQCASGKKLIEYEVYAGDAYKGTTYEPVINRSGNLRLFGWSALGGYYHHNTSNTSTYVVAIEQINGKNTKNTNGVHIVKAKERAVNLTNALSFGGLPTCGTGDINRFRGSYWNSSNQVKVDYTKGFPHVATITDRSSKNNGKKYNTYGNGCNFNYGSVGFDVVVPLKDLYSNLNQNKSYKLHIVKRVNDMIAVSEMAIPNDTTEFNYGYGTLKLDGYARTGDNKVEVNRTGILKCKDYSWKTGCIGKDSTGGEYFRKGEKVDLLDIRTSDGNVSIYTVRRSNGKVYKHMSNYFNYSQDNRGAVLEYKANKTPVTVRHYDIVSCGNAAVGKTYNSLRTQNLVNDCSPLKLKSNGQVAKLGTKEYGRNTTHKFNVYDDGKLFLNNRTSDNYKIYDKSSVNSNRYENFRVGVKPTRLNFFYVNQKDLLTFRINYLDRESGEALYGVDKDNKSNAVRGFKQLRNVLKGTTVTYYNPKVLIGTDNRIYERVAGENTSTSLKLNTNTTLNVRYQKQPIVTVKYVDADTGNEIRREMHQVRYGSNFTHNPSETFTKGGKEYYVYEEDNNVRIPNVTKDTVVEVDYKDTPPQEYPKDRYVLEEGVITPGVGVNTFNWRLTEDRLESNTALRFNANHADAENGRIEQYVGSGNINSQTTAVNNDSGMFKVDTFDPSTPTNFSDTNDFNKNVVNKYQINASYDYTNIYEYNYVCDDGTETRCFDWIVDDTNPRQPYWGDGEDGNTVEINGTTQTARQTYNANLRVNISNSLAKVYELEDLPSSLVIGRGLDSNVNLNDTTNTIGNDHPSMANRTEALNISPLQIEDLDTQTSVTVEEGIDYNNSFSEDLPEPKTESKYYIGDIDNNLRESLGTKEIEDKEYAVSDLRLDNKTFKLDTIFGMSNKYGIQFDIGYENLDGEELEAKLTDELNSVVDDLGFGTDSVESLNYNTSRYFLPIDDEKYDSSYTFEDRVELNSLGLNEVTVNYGKEFSFEKYLYGNIMDEPVYSEQKDSVKKTEYKNTENFNNEQLKSLIEEPERTDKYNLFRATDDKQINSFVNE